MKTTHLIITKHGSYASLVMVITCLNFGRISFGHYFVANLSSKFRMYFFNVKHCIDNISGMVGPINTLRPRQDGRHFADDIFTCIFFNENCWILKFSLKYVHRGPIDNNPALVQIMAWRRSGAKPLSQPIVVSLPTHICVTRPQWVNTKWKGSTSVGHWVLSAPDWPHVGPMRTLLSG